MLKLWVGLLHLVFAVVWPGTPQQAVLQAIQRHSPLGLGSVVLVTLAGVYLSWVRLGELVNLWTTTYGLLLLLKLGLVDLVLLASGELANTEPPQPDA